MAYKIRKLWLTLHRYIALTIGFAFVLMGLTGSINVFTIEVDELLNPSLVIVNTETERRSLDQVMASVQNAHPEIPGPWTFQMPYHDHGMLTASYTLPKEETEGAWKALKISVNPYTAEVVRSYYTGDTVVSWIYSLHWTLLLGDTGRNIIGILGLILFTSVLTGIYLWWPRKGTWKKAFTIKRRAGVERFNFDLHKTFGIYSAAILIILCFSGVYLVYSDYVRRIVNVFSPVTIDPWANPANLTSKPIPGVKPISIDAAVRNAASHVPHGELKRITMPKDTTGVYIIRIRQPGEANKVWPSTAVYIDQYSGRVIANRDPNEFSAGETFLNVQFPLHNGEALHLPGRILICIVGLIPLMLYITGVLHWLQKRRTGKRNKMPLRQN